MNDFLFFFVSFLVIVIIMKKIYEQRNIVSRVSKKDNIEYFVRDLDNSQEAAEKLSVINTKLQKLINSLDENERKGIDRLKKRYNPKTLANHVSMVFGKRRLYCVPAYSDYRIALFSCYIYCRCRCFYKAAGFLFMLHCKLTLMQCGKILL
mgnify:CR=1 FL=1